MIKEVFVQGGLAAHLGGERLASEAGLITALSRQPASLFQIDEFGKFVVRTSRIQEICDPDRFDDVDEAQCFVRASSEFYPQFSRYVAAAIAALYPDLEPEAEDEDHG